MFKFVFAIILVVLCWAAFIQTPAQSVQSKASTLQNLYDAAQRSQSTGDRHQAGDKYRIFLSNALGELANSHAQTGDYAKAASLFDEALALSPDLPSLLRDYAITALQASDLKRAETLSRTLLNDSPQDAKNLALAHQLLGRTLLKLSLDQEARKELEAAAALDSSFANEYDLAVVCLDLDDEKRAVQIFDKIEASYEDTPALHMQIGRAYGNSDFTSRAVAEFKRVLAEAPRYPGAHYSVAAALLAPGEDEKALKGAEKELQQELAISPNDFLTHAALGKIAAGFHRYLEAEQHLKRAISLNPDSSDAYLYLGQMYFDLNRSAEAEIALRKAIQQTTDPSRNHYQIQKAHFLLGRILVQQHRQDEAHAQMELAHALANKALSKDKSQLAGLLGNNPASADAFGASEEASMPVPAAPRSPDKAAAANQKTFEKQLAPAIADSYNNLGAITASDGYYAVAQRYFERAAVWNPSLDGLDYNLGRAAFMASQFSRAIPPLSRYLRSHPQDSAIRAPLAMSQFMTHDYSGCLQSLKRATDDVTAIPQMQYIYAESLVKTGQASLGTERLKTLEAAHPEIAEVHRAIGEVSELRGDRLISIQEFRKALEINPDDPETRADLGKAELESGETADAIEDFESAVRLAPEEARYHQELADAYERAFRMADAEKERRIYEKLQSSREPTMGVAGQTSEKDRDR
jgi:tetratricopeptide (TPR) repeat protein